MGGIEAQQQRKVTVVLADDHPVVRAGVRGLLEAGGRVEVLADIADGESAFEAVVRLQPDIAILDISMKGTNGLAIAERLGELHPSVRVMLLSMHSNDEYVLRALRAGARAYVNKEAAADELRAAVDAVMRGDTFLSPSISRRVLEGYVHRAGLNDRATGPLTARQEEVLRMIASGQRTKQIADELGLSVKTIEAHRAQIMDRLGIHDVPGLVRYAIRAGLIEDDEV